MNIDTTDEGYVRRNKLFRAAHETFYLHAFHPLGTRLIALYLK